MAGICPHQMPKVPEARALVLSTDVLSSLFSSVNICGINKLTTAGKEERSLLQA